MFRIVLDSDGLIKLEKSGMLRVLCKTHTCIIPEGVFEETVKQGKIELYADAFRLEEEIKGKVEVKEAAENFRATEITKGKSLGKGEREVLHLFFNETADAIVSDDRSFLNLLEEKGIAFLNPAKAIVFLKRKDRIKKEEALEALNKIKELIRKDVYEKAKEEVGK